jgi:hypothetical protein
MSKKGFESKQKNSSWKLDYLRVHSSGLKYGRQWKKVIYEKKGKDYHP